MGLLDEVSGGSGAYVPGFKFSAIGDGALGEVTDVRTSVVTLMNSSSPKLDKNGKEQKQLVVTVQTNLRNWDKVTGIPTDDDDQPLPASEDTGLRRFYIRQGTNADALAKAVRDTGAKDILVGGKLGVKRSGERDLPSGYTMFLYDYKYEPPSVVASVSTAVDHFQASSDDPWSTANKSVDPPF